MDTIMKTGDDMVQEWRVVRQGMEVQGDSGRQGDEQRTRRSLEDGEREEGEHEQRSFKKKSVSEKYLAKDAGNRETMRKMSRKRGHGKGKGDEQMKTRKNINRWKSEVRKARTEGSFKSVR